MSTLTMINWIKPIVGLVTYKYPTLEELKPNSRILKQLLDDTNNLIRTRNGEFLLAKNVIHGADDKVVYILRFSEDPPHKTIPEKDHVSVFKPDTNYTDPIKELLSLL